MTAVHVHGSEWPISCLGAPGGVRAWESLETDPQSPPWRLVTDWCLRPRRERVRHRVRRVAVTEILNACPELAGWLW